MAYNTDRRHEVEPKPYKRRRKGKESIMDTTTRAKELLTAVVSDQKLLARLDSFNPGSVAQLGAHMGYNVSPSDLRAVWHQVPMTR